MAGPTWGSDPWQGEGIALNKLQEMANIIDNKAPYLVVDGSARGAEVQRTLRHPQLGRNHKSS